MSSQPPRIGGGLFSKRPGQASRPPPPHKDEGAESNTIAARSCGSSNIHPAGESNGSHMDEARSDKIKDDQTQAEVTPSAAAAPLTLPTASPSAVGTAESLFSPTGSGGFLGDATDPFTSVGSNQNVPKGSESGHSSTRQSADTSPPPPPPPPPEEHSAPPEGKGGTEESTVTMPSLDHAEQRAASAAADSVLVSLRSVIGDSSDESSVDERNKAISAELPATDVDGDRTNRSGIARHPPAHRAPEAIKASSNPFESAAMPVSPQKTVSVRSGVTSPRYVNPFPEEMHVKKDETPTQTEAQGKNATATVAAVPRGGQMKHPSLRHVPEPVKASSNPFGVAVARLRVDSGSLSSPGVTSPRYVNPFPVEMHKSLGSPRSGVVMPPHPSFGASIDSGESNAYQHAHQALDAKALFAEDDWATFLPGQQSYEHQQQGSEPKAGVKGQAAGSVVGEKEAFNVIGERRRKEEEVSDDNGGHAFTVEPPKAVATVEPPKAATVEPPKAATVEPPKAATVEPPKAAAPVEPPKAATVEPPKAAATVEPPKAATVEPPKAAATVEPPKAATVEPPKAATVEPPKAAETVEPPKSAATVGPPKAAATAVPSSVPSISSPGVPTAASLFEDSASPIDFMSGGRGQAMSFSSLIHSGEDVDTVPKQDPGMEASPPGQSSEPPMAVAPLASLVPEPPMRPPAPSSPPAAAAAAVTSQVGTTTASPVPAIGKKDDRNGCGVVFGFGGKVFEVLGGSDVKGVPFPPAAMEDLASYPGPFTASTPRYVVQQYCHRMLSSSTGDEQVLWRLLSAFADDHDAAALNSRSRRDLACAALRGNEPHPAQDSLVRLCWAATDDAEWQRFVESETEEVDWAGVLALASTQGADKFRQFMSIYATKGLATAAANKDATESPARPLLRLVIESFTGQGSMDDMGPKTLDLWPVAAALLLRMGAEDRSALGLRRLGDSLMQAGRVAAADVCYMLCKMVSGAKQLFDPVDDPNAVMCMLLVDHRDISQLSRILQPQALQASEVLEYLGGNSEVEPSLVPFKFAYAQRLAECGLLGQASAYYQQVYGFMKSQPPTRYSKQLRSLVVDFGKRLDLHRKYVTEAELCASDYKLDESDYRGARIWSGIKSLAGGGSRQTTPESTWAKPVQTSSITPHQQQQPTDQLEKKIPPPLVQVPSTAQPAAVSMVQQRPEGQQAVYHGQGGHPVHMDENANPFAHTAHTHPSQPPPPPSTTSHPTPPVVAPLPVQTAAHYGQSPAASRGSWSSGAPVPHTAPGPIQGGSSSRRAYTTGHGYSSSRDSLPGSGSLVSPVASHAAPTGFGTSMAPINPALQSGVTPYPPRQQQQQPSVASPSQGVASPSGPAHRLPSGAFSNAGMASPQPPSATGPQPTFFGAQQQQQPPYSGSQEFMPPPGGRPPLIPPNQQWGARPAPVRTPARESHNEHHSDAFESAGKYLGGILGGLKSAVAGISESISGPSQPEGDPYAIGEENTFYYDEVRKEWRQRGQPEGQIPPAVAAAPPPPAAPLAPPPTGFAPTQRRQYTQGNYVDIMRFG
ncbi:Protein transport protein Sec16B [Perkinsus chesapeaki]|uniref:Protein transport protein Sec16B n=1 Tax=Perkinsus chesapeaki TaxID=330153 RepID=A0A7J6N0A2_PERCH|nr:Protein transport protein Sec16B [Perkinsus chesapeaki]